MNKPFVASILILAQVGRTIPSKPRNVWCGHKAGIESYS